MVSADFDYCIAHVFEREGGFVNHPADKGGPTKYGITKKTLEAFCAGFPVTDKDVFELTRERALDIYYAMYWEKTGIEKLPSRRVKLMLLDQAVHRGGHKAVTVLQEVLKIFFDPSMSLDGIIGPSTIAAVRAADETKLCRKYIQACIRNYGQIVLSDPKQSPFLVGWLNRAFSLWEATL